MARQRKRPERKTGHVRRLDVMRTTWLRWEGHAMTEQRTMTIEEWYQQRLDTADRQAAEAAFTMASMWSTKLEGLDFDTAYDFALPQMRRMMREDVPSLAQIRGKIRDCVQQLND